MTATSPGVLGLRRQESEPPATLGQEERARVPQVEAFEKAMQEAFARHQGRARSAGPFTRECQLSPRAPATKPRPGQNENGEGAPPGQFPAVPIPTIPQTGAATTADQQVMNASTPGMRQSQLWQEPPAETSGAPGGAPEKMTPSMPGTPSIEPIDLQGEAAKEGLPAESGEPLSQATGAVPFEAAQGEPLSAGKAPALVLKHSAGADGAPQTAARPASGERNPADGMTAAPRNQQMNRSDEMNHIAALGEQNLPLALAAASSSKGLAATVDQGSEAFNYAAAVDVEFTLTGSPFVAAQTGADAGNAVGTEVVKGAAIFQESVDSLERISHLMIKEVSLLKRFDASSLAAVLRPDENTELFLRLTQDNGQMAAFVRCERGDFSQLSRHWGQLQASLARHNVQLGPLQERMVHAPLSENSSSLAGGSATANSERHSQQPAPGMISPLGELEIVGSRTEPLQKTTRKTHSPLARGWETWA